MQSEIERFISTYPDVREVDVIALDLVGNLFGKRYPIRDLEKLAKGQAKMPAAMHLMCSQGFPVDAKGYGFDDGDPDANIQLLPGSLNYVSWESVPRAQVMATFSTEEGKPLFWEPRAVLQRVVDSLKAANCFPVVAFELEFYLCGPRMDGSEQIEPPKGKLTGTTDGLAVLSMERLSDYGDCLSEIIHCCEQQGVLTGPVSAELGPGQYEINLHHNGDVMAAADQCVLFQRIVKGVARKYGYQATFMSKPYLQEAGNGFHFHASLYNAAGENLLSLNRDKKLRHVVAGLLELMPASMLFFAPNINSFRRLKPGNNTPLTPNWGYENRSVAVRIPLSDDQNRRVEHRVAGADANPYLAMAVVLAGIHYGIDAGCEPPAPVQEICLDARGLPTDLRGAVELCRQSEILKSYLGEAFVEVFAAQRLSELLEFENAISAREYDWYL